MTGLAESVDCDRTVVASANVRSVEVYILNMSVRFEEERCFALEGRGYGVASVLLGCGVEEQVFSGAERLIDTRSDLVDALVLECRKKGPHPKATRPQDIYHPTPAPSVTCRPAQPASCARMATADQKNVGGEQRCSHPPFVAGLPLALALKI